ncbi:MAG TPA: adenylosuccinate lyase family protein [Actinomycetota bacterium]|nr:adenylosuccinate lyase family protein [Actinomycetota bacterium]
MVARLTDSELYAHLWGTDELRRVFDERPRLQAWLDILVALAQAEADYGLIPAEAGQAIAAGADVDRLDLAYIAAETRRTGHSTLGLIHGLQQVLPEAGGRWVYHAATVQDVTDTWMTLAFRQVARVCWRQLRAIEAGLLALAEAHRDTPMCGRTHGQPGAPITFGLKAAGWADEVRRQLERLAEALPRLSVGQLGGGVGTLAAFGPHGLAVRRRFCERVGLADPGIAWLSARDRPAEMTGLLAQITGTLGRVGNEVLELSRPEIGELAESVPEGFVGSITMPHKVNPEVAEHLVTLARLVRAQHAVLLEGLVAEGERDGRGWKAEWAAVPEACLLAGAALAAGERLVAGLAVHPEAMRANLETWLATTDTGASAAMVDLVLTRARSAREAEPECWP